MTTDAGATLSNKESALSHSSGFNTMLNPYSSRNEGEVGIWLADNRFTTADNRYTTAENIVNFEMDNNTANQYLNTQE